MAEIEEFIHDLDFTHLPTKVVEQVRCCLVDLVGVAAAGTGTRLSQLARNHAVGNLAGSSRDAPLLFDGRIVSPVGAAFANAATIDSMDGHDGDRLAKGHAGAAVLPSALAFLHSSPHAMVHDLITALAVGYEIATRAGVVLHASVSDYHSSGAWNALGAAAIGARLLGLNSTATHHALGIAEYQAPRAPMMRCIDNPTMVKDSSAWGAQAGTSAALLAAQGFTGAPAALLDPGTYLNDNPWDDLGTRWSILSQYFKPYPVCRWAQPAAHAVISLVNCENIAPADIYSVEVTTFRSALRLSARLPETTEQAQYSLPFSVAAAAVHRTLTPAILAAPEAADRHTRRIAKGLVMYHSTEMTGQFPARRLAEVSLTLNDGSHRSSGVTEAEGEPDAPLSKQQIVQKFLNAATPAVGKHRAESLVQWIDDFGECDLMDFFEEVCAPLKHTGGA